MITNKILFLLFPLIFFAADSLEKEETSNTAKKGIHIAWDFECGSLGSWEINENEITLTHAPGSGELWYFFRIDNVLNRTLTFVFEEARSDFFGSDNLPAISYDQNNWSFIKTRFIQPGASNPALTRFSFTHTFAQNRAWIAYTPPFTNSKLDQFLNDWSSHPPLEVRTICETPIMQLRLPALFITDPAISNDQKKTILLLCREESYETGGSWVGLGAIRYLLSDNPVASAIKRRSQIIIIPIFDRDGVALGRAVHPLSKEEGNVYWTETWPEKTFSFYEQRQLKFFLQEWKNEGNNIDLSIRLHSDAWREDLLRPEYASESNFPIQKKLFIENLGNHFLLWYQVAERSMQDTRFSKFVWDLFPESITASSMHEFIFPETWLDDLTFYKTTDDLQLEGELLVRAIGQFLGVPASDPPPFLHGAQFYNLTQSGDKVFQAHCIYRDLLNRPPEYVRVVVDGKEYNLHAIDAQDTDYKQGKIYTGFIPIQNKVNKHHFIATNGSKTIRIPNTGERPGPYLLSNN